MRSRVRRTLSRLKRAPGSLRERWRIDPDTGAFIRHNREVWSGNGGAADARGGGEILLDLHEIQPLLVAESYLLNLLRARLGGRLVVHSVPGREPGGRWKASRGLRETLLSMNVRGHLPVVLTPEQKRERDDLFEGVRGQVGTKEALLDLRVRGTGIGLDIYESYLRRHDTGTVGLDDPRLDDLIREALGLLVFWGDYFRRNDVRAVVSSHDTYVEMNTPVRVAWREGIPVYIPRPNHIMRPKGPLMYSSSYPRYRELFQALPPEVAEAGLERARRDLTTRLEGGEGSLVYMPNLAFRRDDPSAPRVLAEGRGFKAVVFAQAFSDAPHTMEGMLFPDFVEWLRFVSAQARTTDFEWYLKCHPMFEARSLEIVRQALGDDSPLVLIPAGTPHRQLIREGMGIGLTVYGTVAHELPLLGVPVVNAGYNPHVAYDFCATAHSREEYGNLLRNLPRVSCRIDPRDIYEFYFMYGYRTYTDDLVYRSFRGLIGHLGGHGRTVSPRSYRWFLEEWNPARHREIVDRMEAFLESDAVFSWEVDDPARLLPVLREVS